MSRQSCSAAFSRSRSAIRSTRTPLSAGRQTEYPGTSNQKPYCLESSRGALSLLTGRPFFLSGHVCSIGATVAATGSAPLTGDAVFATITSYGWASAHCSPSMAGGRTPPGVSASRALAGRCSFAGRRGVALPEAVLSVIAEAKKYAEGRAVRLEIRNRKDLDGVKKLAAIKMAN